MKRKRCTKCGFHKHLKEFSKREINKNGLTDWCKTCGQNFLDENKGNATIWAK